MNELLVKATRLNKKENANYLENSVIAGCRKFNVSLDIAKLGSMCKSSETKMVFDEELCDFVKDPVFKIERRYTDMLMTLISEVEVKMDLRDN